MVMCNIRITVGMYFSGFRGHVASSFLCFCFAVKKKDTTYRSRVDVSYVEIRQPHNSTITNAKCTVYCTTIVVFMQGYA